MKNSVLIVGLGQVGMGYDLCLDPATHIYTHARAFSVHPGFDLIAGVDPDARRREIFEQKYTCTAYEDVSSALRVHQPDVIAIAAPTRQHNAILQWVLNESRPKTVLCEKPLSYRVDEARQMVLACAPKNVSLYVNYMRRSDEGVIEVKRRLDSGQIGAPVKGIAWYSKGFLHSGSHFFNMLEYWLGSMRHSFMLNRGRLWEDTDPEPDVQITFDRGSVIFVAVREESFSHHTIELVSPNGRLRYEERGKLIQWQRIQPDPLLKQYTVLSPKPEIIGSGMDRYQLHVVEQLARSLDGQDAHLCSGADALLTLESMNKIFE